MGEVTDRRGIAEGFLTYVGSGDKEEHGAVAVIPNSYINPNVRTVGVSKLRSLNASQLRGMDKTLVIQENDQPLAVLLKFDEFLAMQRELMALLETQSVLADKEEMDDIASGLQDIKEGKTQPIQNIRRSLSKAKEKA